MTGLSPLSLSGTSRTRSEDSLLALSAFKWVFKGHGEVSSSQPLKRTQHELTAFANSCSYSDLPHRDLASRFPSRIPRSLLPAW